MGTTEHERQEDEQGSGTHLLEVVDLRTHFKTKLGEGKAVDGVSFCVDSGETVGLLGESGSGKSVTLLSLVRLNPPGSEIVGGAVLFKGEDLLRKSRSEMRRYRGREISTILQDPLSALNPVFTIGYQVREAIFLHERVTRRQAKQRAIDVLGSLHVRSPAERLRSYPHELSGGMRQRVVGAIAVSSTPAVLLADEPTTSLDVTVQLAYLDLLKEIQEESDLAIVFVTHDFGVASAICDRVAVMYAGRIVEIGQTASLLAEPAHPYTRALRDAMPDVDGGELRPIDGQPPSIFAMPAGCPFAPRCAYAHDKCAEEYPPTVSVGSGHSVSCWLHT